MKKLIILSLVLSLGGCASIQRLETTSVSPQAIVIGTNSFNALEATATNYLNLTRCDKTTSKVCRDKAVTAILGPAVLNARKARNDLIAFQKVYPGQLGTQGLYDALQLSITTLTGIMNTYHIGSAAQ
jgi:hypothetical protein